MGEVTLLLDTHIFLWWLFYDAHLPVKTRDMISTPANTILVSSASVWEIATQYRLGKLPEAVQVAENVPKWIEKAGFQSLAITPDHAVMIVYAGDYGYYLGKALQPPKLAGVYGSSLSPRKILSRENPRR